MSKADELVERGADSLQGLSDKAAEQGGVVGRLSEPLADDSTFLRKLKPNLIKARATGKPHVEPDGAPGVRRARKEGGGQRSPLPLIGAALGTGVLLAKLIDWRGHAHPGN
jgi:hypothetical protein